MFTKNGMLKSLELVMGEHEGGRRMREKIRELKEIVRLLGHMGWLPKISKLWWS